MIASATELMKFKRLQRRLNLRRYETMGLLEALWRATIINAKQGDIGRLTNEEIATEIDWPGDPDELIKSLTETSWLDADYSHRLLVHDWKDHCPKYIKGVLARLNLEILTPKVSDLESATNSQRLNPPKSPTQSSAQRKSIAVKSVAVSSESPTQIQNSEPILEETAVGVYLDVLKYEKYLNAVTWSMIEENIIKSTKSFAFWRKLVTAWAALGWNPRNVQGMIECYQRREIPKGKAAPVQSEPEGVKDEMTPEELARVSARRKELKAVLAANQAKKAAEEAARAEAEKAKGE